MHSGLLIVGHVTLEMSYCGDDDDNDIVSFGLYIWLSTYIAAPSLSY